MAENKGLFKPGDPRINRNGRPPKGTSVTDLIRKQADIEVEPGKTYAQAIAEKLIELAAEGDLAAIKYFADRTDGTPKQTIDSTNDNSLNISISKAKPKQDES